MRRHWDRNFWLGFAVLAWVLVGIGFHGQVSLRFAGKADYPAPAALVIHVWSFSAWLVLLTVQVALRRSNRITLHRTLGMSALVIAPVMTWSAIAAEAYSQRFYAVRFPENIRFFPVPITSMAIFILCAAGAFLARKKPDMHKRFIYLATSAVLVAAFFRWWGETIYAALPPGILTEWLANYLGVILLLAAGLAFDLVTRGSIHPLYRVAVPIILALQLTAVAIGQSAWWPHIGSRLAGIPT